MLFQPHLCTVSPSVCTPFFSALDDFFIHLLPESKNKKIFFFASKLMDLRPGGLL